MELEHSTYATVEVPSTSVNSARHVIVKDSPSGMTDCGVSTAKLDTSGAVQLAADGQKTSVELHLVLKHLMMFSRPLQVTVKIVPVSTSVPTSSETSTSRSAGGWNEGTMQSEIGGNLSYKVINNCTDILVIEYEVSTLNIQC